MKNRAAGLEYPLSPPKESRQSLDQESPGHKVGVCCSIKVFEAAVEKRKGMKFQIAPPIKGSPLVLLNLSWMLM